MRKSEFRKEEEIIFINEWTKIVNLLKSSSIDLSKIKLVEEVR